MQRPWSGINIAFLRDGNTERRPHLQSPVFSAVVWKGGFSYGPVTSEKADRVQQTIPTRKYSWQIFACRYIYFAAYALPNFSKLYFLKHKIKCCFYTFEIIHWKYPSFHFMLESININF